MEKPMCKYGSSCYRNNPDHFKQFSHPSDLKTDMDAESTKSREEESVEDLEPPVAKKQRIENDSTAPSIARGDLRPLFYLTKVRGISQCFNDSNLSVGIKDLLSMGDLVASVQFNYLFDVPWLLQQYPANKRNTPILIVYGDQRETTVQLRREVQPFSNIKLFPAKLEIMFGTHHSKMMFLLYTNGMRVVIHTANLVAKDWDRKTQGVWISPLFPSVTKLPDTDLGVSASHDPSVSTATRSNSSCTNFKQDLLEYLRAYGGSGLDEWKQRIREHDMSSARVRLIASVPGAHTGLNMHKWGHMKLKKVLTEQTPCDITVDEHWPVVGQFSSVGSLGPTSNSWLCTEWLHSLASVKRVGKSVVMHKYPSLQLIFPTVDNVRNSLEGYMAGGSIPYAFQTAQKQPYLTNFLCQWKAEGTGRSHAAPHIKSYTRLSPDCSKALWFLVTSANLSKAAWGCLEKKGVQLKIRSYEIGVLFLPTDINPSNSTFCLGGASNPVSNDEDRLPVPFDLPLTLYTKNDKPWVWNTQHKEPDRHGNVWSPPGR